MRKLFKSLMVFEEIVSESLKVIEEDVIGSWRKGDFCLIVKNFSKIIFCSNMENRKCIL